MLLLSGVSLIREGEMRFLVMRTRGFSYSVNCTIKSQPKKLNFTRTRNFEYVTHLRWPGVRMRTRSYTSQSCVNRSIHSQSKNTTSIINNISNDTERNASIRWQSNRFWLSLPVSVKQGNSHNSLSDYRVFMVHPEWTVGNLVNTVREEDAPDLNLNSFNVADDSGYKSRIFYDFDVLDDKGKHPLDRDLPITGIVAIGFGVTLQSRKYILPPFSFPPSMLEIKKLGTATNASGSSSGKCFLREFSDEKFPEKVSAISEFCNVAAHRRSTREEATRRANRVFRVGLATCFMGISSLFYGTYFYLSWDIIEPVTYFISSFFSIAGYFWWFLTGVETNYGDIYRYLVDSASKDDQLNYDESKYAFLKRKALK